jgi:hypothetical protein
MLLLSLALLVAAGCRRPETASPPPGPPPPAATAANEYVGDAACTECHRAECDSYAGTHHAHTLHILDPARPTDVDPPQGAIPHTKLRVDTFAGDYVVTMANDMSRMQPLTLAFGSGKIGVTYATPSGPQSLLEIHKTWFPHERRWAVTLGQEALKDDALGRIRTDGRECILCHSVALPTGAVLPEAKFLGVGCESCHGPAGAHVQAVRARAGDIAIERLGQWDATRINNLCGRCHGTEASVHSQRDRQLTYRFQPIGLMHSRCFLVGQANGQGGLSCVTCHNPHTDAERSDAYYETICLRCHTARTPASGTRLSSSSAKAIPAGSTAANASASAGVSASVSTPVAKAGVTCPINPRNGCIRCHMPARKAVPNSDIAYRMVDHRIAMYGALGHVQQAGSRPLR